MLLFYWELGRDIVERDAENHYGSKFYTSLSRDLRDEIQNASGLSERNIRYTKKLYLFYEGITEILQQVVADSKENILQQVAARLFPLPWGTTFVADGQIRKPARKSIVLYMSVCQ